MILKGNFLYTPKLGELVIREQEYLVVKDGLVVDIYKELPQEYAGEPVTDYGNAIILPAFNDLHIHAPQMVNRGVGFDQELLPWLETYTFPLESRYKDLDFADRSYKRFLNRLWAYGTMRFSAFGTLHKEGTWHLMELTEQSGLSAYIGKVNMDRNSPDILREETAASLADTEELICRCNEELKNVRFILTPRFVPSTTAELMTGLGKLGEKYNLPVQSHLSENRSEVAWVQELHPDIPTYTQVYQDFGLMRPGQTIMAHSIYLSDAEKETLKERHVMLAHCAQSNADLSSGIMPLRKNLEMGLDCCIASDVAGSHTVAMNRHLAMSIEVSKLNWLTHPEDAALTLPEALYLATKKSGSFFGKVGSFEPGYEFDALVVKTDDVDGKLPRNPFERLELFVYDGDDRDIKVRYCRGKEVKKPFVLDDNL